MGFRLYKSVGLGKGVRLNLSKTGVGISAGIPGARYSVHSSGRTTRTAGIPGTGVYYRKDSYAGRSRSTRSPATSSAPVASIYPKAGLLAPKKDKLFVEGVTAYMQGRYDAAVKSLQDSAERDTANEHVGEEFFLAMSLIGLERASEAIPYLEAVIASDHPLPDPIMLRYGVAGDMVVGVTPMVEVTVPMSNLSAALMLAEAYQHTGQSESAIELLESLGSVAPNEPVFALSLADLYTESSDWHDAVRVTDGTTSNEDDVSLNILVYRAGAMVELEMYEAALELTKECLRFKKRNPDLLKFARYLRGRAYEGAGKAGMAKREFERVYAQDASFADVAEKLGVSADVPSRPDE